MRKFLLNPSKSIWRTFPYNRGLNVSSFYYAGGAGRNALITASGCDCCLQRRNMGSLSPVITDTPVEVVPSAEMFQTNLLDYIESVQQTGKVAVLFSDFPPVLLTVDLLSILKDLPGMSWIMVILSGTLLIRAFVGLPVAIVQQKSISRLETLKPDFEKLSEDLKREVAVAVKKFQWNEKTARIQYTKSYKKHWRRIVEENNCHPMRNLALSLTQLPFWICFSSAIRNIVYAVPYPRTPDKTERWLQIHSESTPWVDSLVLPDPVVFPVVFLVTNLLNIEFNRRQRLQTVPETKIQKYFPWVLRGGIVIIACFATSVPSAVSLYWATSSSLAFAQNVFLSTGTAKRIFKLPTLTSSQSGSRASLVSSRVKQGNNQSF